jgi:hypothetical protein
VEDKDYLKKFLTTPPVKKIDLHFPLGLEVTARNLKGVTIKDALDAIYKQFRKKVCACRSSRISGISIHPSTHPLPSSFQIKENKLTTPQQEDDELENPVLAGFEWDKEESWTRLIVHCKKEGAAPMTKKSKKKAKDGEEE